MFHLPQKRLWKIARHITYVVHKGGTSPFHNLQKKNFLFQAHTFFLFHDILLHLHTKTKLYFYESLVMNGTITIVHWNTFFEINFSIQFTKKNIFFVEWFFRATLKSNNKSLLECVTASGKTSGDWERVKGCAAQVCKKLI